MEAKAFARPFVSAQAEPGTGSEVASESG